MDPCDPLQPMHPVPDIQKCFACPLPSLSHIQASSHLQLLQLLLPRLLTLAPRRVRRVLLRLPHARLLLLLSAPSLVSRSQARLHTHQRISILAVSKRACAPRRTQR